MTTIIFKLASRQDKLIYVGIILAFNIIEFLGLLVIIGSAPQAFLAWLLSDVIGYFCFRYKEDMAIYVAKKADILSSEQEEGLL